MSVALPDEFGWKCANVLIGDGDPYSTAGAEAFLRAARSKNIDVCKRANYVHKSGDMRAAIKKIIDKRCCTVTVVFGQPKDLVALFVEAYEQDYDDGEAWEWEWIVGDIFSSSHTLMSEMQNWSRRKGGQLSESQVHRALSGMHAFNEAALVVAAVNQCLRANRA